MMSDLRDALAYSGALAELARRTSRAFFTTKLSWGDLARQIEVIGLQSLTIVVLTAVFSSLVMTVQFSVQLARFGAKEYVANVISLSLVRELGPVLTALMVGGRIGAGIAAELGSMNVTEQIDALRSMGADPVRKLVLPRILASMIVLPLLTMFAVGLGIGGAMAISSVTGDVNPTYFFSAVLQSVHVSDLAGGLLKSLFFGFLLSLIACHQGLSTTGGTEGVGRATTEAVVITSIVTLISDFILTTVLLQFGL